jgi:hypothetical protein
VARHRPEPADLPEQPPLDADPLTFAGAAKAPLLREKYCRIAPDSKIKMSLPPGPFASTISRIRLFGAIARNSGVNCSPRSILTSAHHGKSPRLRRDGDFPAV